MNEPRANGAGTAPARRLAPFGGHPSLSIRVVTGEPRRSRRSRMGRARFVEMALERKLERAFDDGLPKCVGRRRGH
jgi:hypothetical protein